MSSLFNSDAVNELLAFFKGRNEGLSAIGQTTLTGSVASVTFDLTDYQQFRHLLLVANVRADRVSTNDAIKGQFNGDSGNNYDYSFFGTINATFQGGNSIAATDLLLGDMECANSLANSFSESIVLFSNYTNTSIYKFCLSITGNFGTPAAATTRARVFMSQWRSTNAVTSLLLFPNVGPNFVANSIFALYGIY